LATSVIVKKTAKSKQSPNMRKIAQSGHPVAEESLFTNTIFPPMQVTKQGMENQ
jgi:hypothetical protein